MTAVTACASSAPTASSRAASAAAATPPPAPLTRTAAGNAETGREAFASDCRVCHGGLIAPPLRGIAGRKIAGEASYSGYSDALRAKTGAWTDANLDAYLASPATFAPGTKMGISVPDAGKRADIIAFLKTLAAPS